MSENKRREAVSTVDFIRQYIPLQREGLTRAEIAERLGMVDENGKFDSFNTKLSNAALELFVGTMTFKTPEGGIVDGDTFATSFRDALREQAIAEAVAADYSDEENPGEAREKAVDKAGKLTKTDAMRVIRRMFENGELPAANADVERNTKGGIVELPNPKGGRSSRDLSALGNIVVDLLN